MNFVPVRSDLSDLIDQLLYYRANPNEAQEVARRGQSFARKALGQEASMDYVLRAVSAYHALAETE